MEKFAKNMTYHHKLLISIFTAFVFILALLPSEKATASRNTDIPELVIGKNYHLPVSLDEEESGAHPVKDELALKHHTITVKKGDNLAKIFKRAGFTAKTLHNVTSGKKGKASLKKIHPGDQLEFTSVKGELVRITYPLSMTETLIIEKQESGYVSHTETKEVESRLQFSSNTITSNFWNAGVNAGLEDAQIMNLANIFGWDIDFANDIQKGDQFSILFEENYIDGEYAGRGKIIAAEFINQGETFTAIRFTDGEFYTPEGRSMRKAFLRAPVDFKYISSSFNPRRLHPVTGRVSAHRGIDYAARTGTPVVASGNGKVIKSAYSRLNGNYVFIQHGSQYVTKYLHLHKRYVKTGQKVKQGQRIGSVGATGRVTGAHLHYEFLVNGVHRNPRTVKLPKSRPLEKKDRSAFERIAKEAVAALKDNQRVMLAFNS